MTAKFLRNVTEADKPAISGALKQAGIKARLRVFRQSIRIVAEGDWQIVAGALNNAGYRTRNGDLRFGRYSFNDMNPAHLEVFVSHAEPV